MDKQTTNGNAKMNVMANRQFGLNDNAFIMSP